MSDGRMDLVDYGAGMDTSVRGSTWVRRRIAAALVAAGPEMCGRAPSGGDFLVGSARRGSLLNP